MNKKNLFIGVLIIAVVVFGSYAGFSLWQSYRWRTMGHGPGGFDQEQQQTVPGMPIDRERQTNAFSVKIDVPGNAVSGENVNIEASVSSNTAPHARTVLKFFVDDKEIESKAGLIPPGQTVVANFIWQAEKGEHKIKVVVSSAAGISYDEDEKVISVKETTKTEKEGLVEVKSVCGNNILEGNEICDGTDLNGKICTNAGFGFTGGTLKCKADCSGFDTSDCFGGMGHR